jgi:hypothetical protein
LLLLPVLLLAALGIYQLRRDQLSALNDARERCQALAEDRARVFAIELAAHLSAAETPEISTVTIDESGALKAIDGSPNRAVTNLIPMPRPFPIYKLSPEQRESWQKLQEGTFSKVSDRAALHEFLKTSPPRPFLTQARYNLALAEQGLGNSGEARELFRKVSIDQESFTEGGLPLGVLGAYHAYMQGGGDSDFACSNAVEHPSLITPTILRTVGGTNSHWM